MDAPPQAALQGRSPLMPLPRASACLCCGSAELLKLFWGFASVPAADSTCNGLVQAGLTKEDGEAL